MEIGRGVVSRTLGAVHAAIAQAAVAGPADESAAATIVVVHNAAQQFTDLRKSDRLLKLVKPELTHGTPGINRV